MTQMDTVPFAAFADADKRKFRAACENHARDWTDFYVLGLVLDETGKAYPSLRIRVEYLPTGKAIHYSSGESMSWIVSFEVDLGRNLYA